MKNLIQTGLKVLPVIGEILFIIVLGDELRERINNWRKKKQKQESSQEPVPEEPGGDE